MFRTRSKPAKSRGLLGFFSVHDEIDSSDEEGGNDGADSSEKEGGGAFAAGSSAPAASRGAPADDSSDEDVPVRSFVASSTAMIVRPLPKKLRTRRR
eukprot:1987880-Pleurochrysis_carterae.AAC.1